jgi:hypothetical protein
MAHAPVLFDCADACVIEPITGQRLRLRWAAEERGRAATESSKRRANVSEVVAATSSGGLLTVWQVPGIEIGWHHCARVRIGSSESANGGACQSDGDGIG